MSRINSARNGCKDVFNAFLVALATYAGIFEFPEINRKTSVATDSVRRYREGAQR